MRRPGFCSLLALAALPARPVYATVASDICPATADPCVVSTAKTVTPGSTLDLGSRALDVRAGGSLNVSSGLMTILAGSVRVESGGALLGSSTQDTGASIKVMTSGDIRVETGASGGGSFGDGGTVTVIASGNVTVNGNYVLPGAGSLSQGGGDGGDADVEGTAGTVTLNGDIDSHGASPDGDAGEVDITAGLDYRQPGSIFDQANGRGGCGGTIAA